MSTPNSRIRPSSTATTPNMTSSPVLLEGVGDDGLGEKAAATPPSVAMVVTFRLRWWEAFGSTVSVIPVPPGASVKRRSLAVRERPGEGASRGRPSRSFKRLGCFDS